MPPVRGVTRRRLLATGGAAGVVALGFQPWSPEPAGAAIHQDVADYLIRSPYLALSTPNFAIGATTAKLEAVSDLPAATQDTKLAGSEDAFSLTFSTTAPLEPGIQAFSHPDLGQFELFIAPIEGKGLYEVVVNRSVNAPKHYPRPPKGAETRTGPAAPPRPGEKAPGAPRVKPAKVRRVTARRLSRGFACSIGLEPGADVESAVVWITRGGLVVAAHTVRRVHGNRIAVRIPTRHRPRGGRHEITVRTKDRHGHVDYKLTKLTLN